MQYEGDDDVDAMLLFLETRKYGHLCPCFTGTLPLAAKRALSLAGVDFISLRGRPRTALSTLPCTARIVHSNRRLPRTDCPIWIIPNFATFAVEASDCYLACAKRSFKGRRSEVSIFPNFQKKQHCIHVVVTFMLQCCFWKCWTTLPHSEITRVRSYCEITSGIVR